MENVNYLGKHQRDHNGNVYLTNDNHSRNANNKNRKSGRGFLPTAIAFVAMFSILAGALTVALANNTALASRLDSVEREYKVYQQQHSQDANAPNQNPKFNNQTQSPQDPSIYNNSNNNQARETGALALNVVDNAKPPTDKIDAPEPLNINLGIATLKQSNSINVQNCLWNVAQFL